MAKFYTLGCYTAKGLGGFVSNPSTDRKAATSALAASVGAKVTQYSGLRGKYDFMVVIEGTFDCLLYTSPSPRDRTRSRMPSSA